MIDYRALRPGQEAEAAVRVEVSGDLSAEQWRLARVLLRQARDAGASLTAQRIDAAQLCAVSGCCADDLAALLRGLVGAVVSWGATDEAGGSETGAAALVASVRITGAVCDYAISPLLAERLSDPAALAQLSLAIQRRLLSGHALMLYETCLPFAGAGVTDWWAPDDLRRLLLVAQSPYYDAFKHLHAKVIKPAVAEVTRVSDMRVTAEIRKTGRLVTGMRFALAAQPEVGGAPPMPGAGEVSPRNPGATPAALPSGAMRLARIQALARARTPTQKDADRRLFLARLDGAARDDFERHGWMSALNAPAILAFWEEVSPGAFDGIGGGAA